MNDGLSGLLTDLIHQFKVPGAQLAVRHNGETELCAAGVRNAEFDDPISVDSLFPFGSVTKAVTATVAMQLVSDGDLCLDVPVAEYAPELRQSRFAGWRRVTLRHLLSHTGGVVSNHDTGDRQATSLRRYVQHCRDLACIDVPGSVFSYSNTGYALVGRVIEASTGLGWWRAVDAFLAQPLGLRIAEIDDPAVAKALVSPHAVNGGGTSPIQLELPAGWAPAGGLAGTTVDLVEFAALHLGAAPAVLDVRTAAAMREPVGRADPFGLANGWGLGWAVFEDGWVGHDGTLAGCTCHVRLHPGTGTVVALATNATSGLALWTELVRRLGRIGLPVGDYTIGPGATRLIGYPAEYVGDYVNGTTILRVRPCASGALRLADGAGFTATCALWHGDVFGVHRSDTNESDTDEPTHVGRFLRDATGQVHALQLSGRIAVRLPARRAMCVGA